MKIDLYWPRCSVCITLDLSGPTEDWDWTLKTETVRKYRNFVWQEYRLGSEVGLNWREKRGLTGVKSDWRKGRKTDLIEWRRGDYHE